MPAGSNSRSILSCRTIGLHWPKELFCRMFGARWTDLPEGGPRIRRVLESYGQQGRQDAELILKEAQRQDLHLPMTLTQAGLLRTAIALKARTATARR